MAASTVGRSVGRIYTHTSAQCSPASVGLAQARPNNTAICSWRSKFIIHIEYEAARVLTT